MNLRRKLLLTVATLTNLANITILFLFIYSFWFESDIVIREPIDHIRYMEIGLFVVLVAVNWLQALGFFDYLIGGDKF